MLARLANERQHFDAVDVKPLKFKDELHRLRCCQQFRDLTRLGLGLDASVVHQMAMFDVNPQAPFSTPSVTTPIQFLQRWLTGFVEDLTAARKIDSITGITMQGEWSDEEIVQGLLERTGSALPYTDLGNTQQSSWNVNYERRTIVRHELGIQVGRLEEARAAAIRLNSADAKRAATMRELEIVRNRIGFNGYNDGANRTYGLLNSPGLPGYTNAPGGVWSAKSFDAIKNDILLAAQTLRTQSEERIDPTNTPITLAVAMSAVDYLHQATNFGLSVYDWLKNNYGNIRVVSAPELDAANGSENVFYLFADKVEESGTDDTRTFIQIVPTKFQTLGVAINAKNYEEAYSNATAGVLLKRPYAIVRFTGI